MPLQRAEQNGRYELASVHSTGSPHCGQETLRGDFVVINLTCRLHMQRYAFGAESAAELFVASRDLRAAIWTGTLLAQIVVANVVPVTNHTRVLAVRTKRCTACGVMHVTGVNVMQPRIHRNAARAG